MMKKHLPNMLTMGNMTCGLAGIVAVMGYDAKWALIAVIGGSIFDFFDGFVARRLRVSSAIGKDLDSLADMVTFGVLPSLMIFEMAESHLGYLSYLAFVPALFSALRLAKFNQDTRQSEQFIGVPTPANALFLTSLPYLMNELAFNTIDMAYILVGMGLINSVLMNVAMPMMALKFKHFGWKGNESKYILLAVSAVGLFVWGFAFLPIIFVVYIVFSWFVLSQR